MFFFQKIHQQPSMNDLINKPKLCRTSKSVHGISQHRNNAAEPQHISINSSIPAFNKSSISAFNNSCISPHKENKSLTAIKSGVGKTLSEKFSNLGVRNYSVFRNGK